MAEEGKNVLRDDQVGWALRKRMFSEGVGPSTHPYMKGLTEMAKRKTGAQDVAERLADNSLANGSDIGGRKDGASRQADWGWAQAS